MRIRARICLLLLFGALLLAPMQSGGTAPAQEGRQQGDSSRDDNPQDNNLAEQSRPFGLGLQEEAGVTLLFLDVKVRDKKGRPVRGLTLDDFEVSINGRLWPLAAVDDFCNCDGSPGVEPHRRARGESTDKTAGPATEAAAQSESSLPQHFVLYLDFSELQHTGRVEAERQARRWLEEGMRPGDRVMLAGFSTAAGLVEITPFTSDRAVLLQALETAFADEAFVDPFPLFLPGRMQDCVTCYPICLRTGDPYTCSTGCCHVYAMDEASQGRRALEALELFVTTLEDLPGRKQILYFNQNNLLYPRVLYPPLRGMQAWSIPDQLQLLEKVAAT
ncbi:MAG: hypothetical protein O7C74_03500, partial [Acidobacteria bacterium]|nr:hypothetical protein [Acidobacteriota bacterium]